VKFLRACFARGDALALSHLNLTDESADATTGLGRKKEKRRRKEIISE
jgi:hypothetical protein